MFRVKTVWPSGMVGQAGMLEESRESAVDDRAPAEFKNSSSPQGETRWDKESAVVLILEARRRGLRSNHAGACESQPDRIIASRSCAVNATW